MNTIRIKSTYIVGVVAAAALLLVIAMDPVQADGFRNPPEGAAALARGGARVTQADDPTTISHNPANLMDLEGQIFIKGAFDSFNNRIFYPGNKIIGRKGNNTYEEQNRKKE